MEPDRREADFARRAAAGDVDAYEWLYRRHVGRIHALCLRMSRDPSEAEDLVQDVFVRAFERLGSFRGDSAFGTWVYRVAVNLVLESFRKKSRWTARIDDEVEPELALDAAVAGVGALPAKDLDLERAVAALPARARLVFVLHDVEGYKHREIADMTNTAVGTCKAHLHNARKKLRDALSTTKEELA